MAASCNLFLLATQSSELSLWPWKGGCKFLLKSPPKWRDGCVAITTWQLLELVCPWEVNMLLVSIIIQKDLLRHTAGVQKESHFPLKLWKMSLSTSLALKTYWGYRSGVAASISSRFCQILAMHKHSKDCLIRKAHVCSFSEALITRRDRELLISQKQTWTFPAACT